MTVENSEELTILLDYLKRSRGFDFSGYKSAGLVRRIQKRMRTVNIADYLDYMDFLEVHPEEFVQLFNTILINVTSFFRDPEAWQLISERVLPDILANKQPGEPIRVWSTGCASGEEAYTLAMLLAEAVGEEEFRERVKVYATDVDEEALSKARLALYTPREIENLPKELLDKYFYLQGENYCFRKDLRRNVIFGRNDLIQDAPISRLDVLVCRNTLMYFNAEVQHKILGRFHFSLNEKGYLFLGKAETLFNQSNSFVPVNVKLRIFQKVPRQNKREGTVKNLNQVNDEATDLNLLRDGLRDKVFDTAPVAMIVVSANNSLVMANEQARLTLGVNKNDIGKPFQDIELSYRPLELRSYIQRSYSERTPQVIRDVQWGAAAIAGRYYDVRLLPITENGSGYLGVSISFIDVSKHKALQAELERINNELETALEELQSTNEELETTNEELQSTIEELETTNEELQSTNQELETMNEELQSTNEELSATNDELQVRTDEVNQLNDFTSSVLTSLQAGIAVLDRDLKVLVWNRKSEDLWGLRPEEVEGRNFLKLDFGLPVEKIKKLLLASLTDGVKPEEARIEAVNRRGRQITCKVTCNPLVGANDSHNGVIIWMEEEHAETIEADRK